jgi:endogenous inhibitor of DNA gyrase (YacG/DUF329 family)
MDTGPQRVGCPQCGHTFPVVGNRDGGTRQERTRSKSRTARCDDCGKQFETHNPAKRFCTRTCQLNRYNADRNHNYRARIY